MEDQNNEAGQPAPEQVTSEVQATPPIRRALPISFLLILVVIGFVVWCIFGRKAAWDAASYLPKDVAVAAVVDFSANADKTAGREFIVGVLRDAGVKDPEKKAFDAISKELKMDVEKDVLPLLNGKGGFAVGTEVAGGVPPITLVVGAKSAGSATKLLDVVKRKLKAEDVPFTEAKHEGSAYIKVAAQTIYVCVGSVGSGLVVTAGEDAFKQAVKNCEGNSSLARNEHFNKYKSSAPSTVLTVFYSGPGLYKLIGPYMAMGMASAGPDAPEQMKRALESAVAAVGSVQLSGSGIKVVSKGLSTEEPPTLSPSPLEDLVAGVPADSAFAICAQDIDKLWAGYKRQVAKMPNGAASLAEVTDKIKAAVGVDVFEELVAHVKSAAVYYTPKPPAGPDAFPGTALCKLKVDSPNRVSNSLAKVHAALGKMPGWAVSEASVSGQKAAVISGGGDEDANIVDAVVGDELIIGLAGVKPDQAAASVMRVAQTGASSIASGKGFKAVKAHLPARSWAVMYGDVGKIIQALQDQFASDKDRKTALAVVKKVGPFGGASVSSGKESEAVFFVPFMQ